MRLLASSLIIATSTSVWAQSATEHHAWQDASTFEPASRTASAITGAITLSGNVDFASPGSEVEMTFGNGNTVGLVSVGASWRSWVFGSEEKQTAEAFQIDRDPGELINGNSLCGTDRAEVSMFAVFYESSLFGLPPKLNLAVFQSAEPPIDIESLGLCGTYSYDIPLEQQGEQNPAQTALLGSKWSVRKSINPLDDTPIVVLSLQADSGKSTYGDLVKLVARCKSNETEVYATWGDYLGDDSSNVYSEWKNVTVRVGKRDAQVGRWGVSTDGRATFAPNWAGNLLKDLLDQDRLVLQTVPYGENPITAVFDVSGLRSVLGELAKECHCTLDGSLSS